MAPIPGKNFVVSLLANKYDTLMTLFARTEPVLQLRLSGVYTE